jgi:hypothetical protein
MRGRCGRTVGAVTFGAGVAARGGVVVRAGAGVAGLGDVHLAAVPEGVTPGAPPGIEVIRRGDPGSARRETLHLRLPPSDHLPPPLAGDGEVVLHEHDPQHPGLMQPRQERQIRITAGGGVHRLQQRVPSRPYASASSSFFVVEAGIRQVPVLAAYRWPHESSR